MYVRISVCVNAVTMSAMVILFAYSELVDDEEFYGNPSAWAMYGMDNVDLGESANSEDLVKLGSTSSQAPLLQSFNAKVRDSTPKCSANIFVTRWVIRAMYITCLKPDMLCYCGIPCFSCIYVRTCRDVELTLYIWSSLCVSHYACINDHVLFCSTTCIEQH